VHYFYKPGESYSSMTEDKIKRLTFWNRGSNRIWINQLHGKKLYCTLNFDWIIMVHYFVEHGTYIVAWIFNPKLMHTYCPIINIIWSMALKVLSFFNSILKHRDFFVDAKLKEIYVYADYCARCADLFMCILALWALAQA
jgi:hypothetical protein